MNVPFMDLKAQYNIIKDEVTPRIEHIFENTAYVSGKGVAAFEQEFAMAHNVKYCSGVSSGTDGNHMVLWALGIGPGDEVIIPANTFIATAWGATLCGATPVFVDCNPVSYNLDPNKLEMAITPKTKAIVAVHLYGQPADMDSIQAVADKHNITVVEDCAQAHLSEYKGRKVGSLAKAASFSFYPGKNLGAFGEAGAVVTNDEALAATFKMMRDHGSEQKYTHKVFGHNYRMEELQGNVLSVKLKHLDSWTQKRRAAADTYRKNLQGINQIIVPEELPENKHVYHLFVIQVKTSNNDSENAHTREGLQRFLKDNNIASGLHYPIPLHLQPCFEYLGYQKGDLPVSETLAKQCLSLPMFPELTEAQIQYVCENIRNYFTT